MNHGVIYIQSQIIQIVLQIPIFLTAQMVSPVKDCERKVGMEKDG